jgi:hypothetical protein
MDENKLEIGAIVSLDLNPLEQELVKAEQLLQGFAQRSAAIGDSTPDRPVVQSSSDGSAPIAPLPQPAPLRMPSDEVLRNMPQPPPSSLPQVPQAAQDAQLTQMRAEMEMIRSFAKSSPDIALHALAGRGGLAQRALRSGEPYALLARTIPAIHQRRGRGHVRGRLIPKFWRILLHLAGESAITQIAESGQPNLD